MAIGVDIQSLGYDIAQDRKKRDSGMLVRQE